MSTFSFKQFSVAQNQAAMKIGTDAVLLGAWTPLTNNPCSILDIGAGTGIIALMLAQRSAAAQIDGLEIEENAYVEASENFENSPWNDRLFCYHASLDEFMNEPEDEYDLIVSNPPFYSEDYKSNDVSRDMARFQDSLPFEDLLEASDMLLSDQGILSVIIPFKEEEKFLVLAEEFKLYPLQVTHVKGTPHTPIKRSLLALSRQKVEKTSIDELIIETDRHQYTTEYIELTKYFYLKM